MPKNRVIFICDSHQPRIHGGGCCSDKGSHGLQVALQKLLEEKDLSETIEVRFSGCLRNCRQGISMKILPDNVLYAKVKPTDLHQIVEQHLLKDRPVQRLVATAAPRYLSF